MRKIIIFSILYCFSWLVQAHEHEDRLKQILMPTLKGWCENPVIIDEIKQQNKKHINLTHTQLKQFDAQWREQVLNGEFGIIDDFTSKTLSNYLKKIKDQAKGLYTEIIVMDAKGLNVGQSDPTSDYWQGDEDKWLKTFLLGPDTIHIGEVELDESTRQYQSQVSVSIKDPDTKKVIGAMTVGIDVNLALDDHGDM